MTHWTDATDLLDEREERSQGFVARYAPGALAFTLSAALGVYLVYLRPLPNGAITVAETPAAQTADPFGGLAPVTPPPAVALNKPAPEANPFGGLVTKGFGSNARFQIAEAPVPVPPVPPADLRPNLDADGVPLPPRRPNQLRSAEAPSAPVVARLDPKPAAPAAAPAPAASPGLFEKLFGGVSSQPKTQAPTLAYAAPPPVAGSGINSALAARNGGLGSPGGAGGFLRGLNMGSNPASRYGERVAVYDISARVVYMPDGTRLEAHSGLGSMRDDPSSVGTRMKGATPPATYALTPRESLFHGVEALRLTPLDSNVFGRAGLLAHTYMLGPDGDSNGCISFRDYDAFLRAYRNGVVNKLVVVTRL